MAIFFNKKRKIRKKLYINQSQIKCVESTKYLGLTIDYKLSWDEHIENSINGAIQKQKILTQKTRSIHGPKPKLMKWVFSGVVRPKLSYASSIWFPSLKKKKTS